MLDPTIVRGQDYYTGTVFETNLKGAPDYGSVMSGGRYDGLIGMFAGQDVPAVGISAGVDRLLAALQELGSLPPGRASARVLVTMFAPETRDYSLRVARALREACVNTEVYLDAGAKLAKQMKYASRKGIAKVVIAGPEEAATGEVTLRDMATGEQTKVSLANLAAIL
jgi:histidyl-tRNA synthetase